MTENTIAYKYAFTLEEGDTKEIQLHLDKNTLDVICEPVATEKLPLWTLLEYKQCPNCPLDANLRPYCPIAVNILTLAESFSDFVSYQKAKVSVETDTRLYVKETDLQTVLSAILGIYMVSSGCPIMDKLRPMVRFHLPFASYDETQYRAISMYLTAQYLRYKKGKKPDWDLNGFIAMYEDIGIVNNAFAGRLRQISPCDANTNALVILDSFASFISFEAEVHNSIPEELESLFKVFLDEP